MAKKECSKGHIYDTAIYGDDCPFCSTQSNTGETVIGYSGKTVISGSAESTGSVSGDDTKECPYCAETIKKKAAVCRFCGRDLPLETGLQTTAADGETQVDPGVKTVISGNNSEENISGETQIGTGAKTVLYGHSPEPVPVASKPEVLREDIGKTVIQAATVKSTLEYPVTVYKIGDRSPSWGLVFYDKGQTSNGWRYLEAAPADLGLAPWEPFAQEITSTSTAIGIGRRNTQIIADALGQKSKNGWAVQLCVQYTGGGKNDWYLPNIQELSLMYENLKSKGLGGFTDGWYWSSSEYANSYAWCRNFKDGWKGFFPKGENFCVRAVRAF